MAELFLLAGVPPELHTDFAPKINRDIKDKRKGVEFIYAPLTTYQNSSTGWCYTDEYIEKVFAKTYRHISKQEGLEKRHSRPDTVVTLLYLEHDAASTERLLKKFFPLVLSMSCECVTPNAILNKGTPRRAEINKLARRFKKATKAVREVLSTLQDELSSNDNRTPLLLPLKNFRSKCLSEHLGNLSMAENYCSSESTSGFKAKVNAMRPKLGFKRTGDDKKKCYHDERNIAFKSPGKHRHGIAALSSLTDNKTEHYSCLLGAFFRLGVPYDPQFHYDCVASKNLPRKWLGCHSQDELIDKA